MKFLLKRIARKTGYTIGKLYQMIGIEDASTGRTCRALRYLCDTLEPQWRDYAKGAKKVKGESAIPEGTFKMVVTKSPRFRQLLPLLLDVPDFYGIRIHAGNDKDDTQGCILVGENKVAGMVLNSRAALAKLLKLMGERPEGEVMTITIE